mgnify:CR=1 FL=1
MPEKKLEGESAIESTLQIQCPKCEKLHSYLIEAFVSLIFLDNPYSTPPPRKREFTRLFTCPTTKQDFQAKFALLEKPGTILRTANVKGEA